MEKIKRYDKVHWSCGHRGKGSYQACLRSDSGQTKEVAGQGECVCSCVCIIGLGWHPTARTEVHKAGTRERGAESPEGAAESRRSALGEFSRVSGFIVCEQRHSLTAVVTDYLFKDVYVANCLIRVCLLPEQRADLFSAQ